MKKSIFTVCVPITSQEQADRLKQVCLDEGLPIWDDEDAFKFIGKYNVFGCDKQKDFFVLSDNHYMKHTQATEAEFMELLKEYKNGK